MAACRPPRKTKSSPVFPVVGQLLQRHARHIASNAPPAGGQRLAIRIVERELEAGGLNQLRRSSVLALIVELDSATTLMAIMWRRPSQRRGRTVATSGCSQQRLPRRLGEWPTTGQERTKSKQVSASTRRLHCGPTTSSSSGSRTASSGDVAAPRCSSGTTVSSARATSMWESALGGSSTTADGRWRTHRSLCST